jgi:8-oxo-dGTP pyrophosphatase MutT (NUDIX family)
VTSIKKRRWVFPKGFVAPGETAPQAALKEAWEEAGLRGRIVGDSIGTYKRSKGRFKFVVECFTMYVDRQSRRWQESTHRDRTWLPISDAVAALGHHPQRRMLVAAMKLIRNRRPRAG